MSRITKKLSKKVHLIFSSGKKKVKNTPTRIKVQILHNKCSSPLEYVGSSTTGQGPVIRGPCTGPISKDWIIVLKIPSSKLKYCPKKDQKGHKIPNHFLSTQFNFQKLGLYGIYNLTKQDQMIKNKFQDVCFRAIIMKNIKKILNVFFKLSKILLGTSV